MNGIPVARCAFLVPFVSILTEMGAPTGPLLAKFRLPAHPEEKADCYMPLLPALRFVTTAQVSQGITDFGFHAGRRLDFSVLSNRFQKTVRHSPTLLAALESWCNYIEIEDPFLRVRLKRADDAFRICTTTSIVGGGTMPHLEHAQWLYNMMTIYIVRQFAGASWTPANFAFQARYTPGAETQSFWPNTRFISGQSETWIDVPISHLCLPNPLASTMHDKPQDQQYPPIGTSLVSTLKLIVTTHLDERIPSLEQAAEIAGSSVRSLQRELAADGLTYSRLLDQVRFERAAEMLRETDIKIVDIAHATGYSDAAHFTRAHRRFTGLTPREFRENWRARRQVT
jgi:AraC-like DNA-binding protein